MKRVNLSTCMEFEYTENIIQNMILTHSPTLKLWNLIRYPRTRARLNNSRNDIRFSTITNLTSIGDSFHAN